MIYVSCEGAYGGSGAPNIVNASVKAGASCAVGFTESINTFRAGQWTADFISLMAEGYTVNEAVLELNNRINDMNTSENEEYNLWVPLKSATVVGNGNYKFID